jgi:MFS family permease
LGWLLLCLSLGAVVAMPLAGSLVQRVQSGRALAAGVAAVTTGTVMIATGLQLRAVAVVAVGLAVSGAGMSAWDVAMNVQGADVERHTARVLMPRFHAAFSLGTALGAVAGAAAAAAGLSVTAQLAVTAPLVAAATFAARRRFLTTDEPLAESHGGRLLTDAWRDPRLRIIGVVVFAFALIEGVANDWLALAVTDGLEVAPWLGSLAFGVFAAAMTAGRLGGTWMLARHGRVAALRVTAGLAATGTLLVIAAPTVVAAIVGAALWGIGSALGFPVGMSAAADDRRRAAPAVAVVSTIGYTAFLGGPPLVGLLADYFGLQPALLTVVAAAGLAFLAAGVTGQSVAARAPASCRRDATPSMR